jgi:hypothetical protein
MSPRRYELTDFEWSIIPVMTSTRENVSDIGIAPGLSLGPPVRAGVRSKRGAVHHSSGVVTDHGVAQRLALHAGQPSGFRTGHSFQRVGDGAKARAAARGLVARLAQDRSSVAVHSPLIARATIPLSHKASPSESRRAAPWESPESDPALSGITGPKLPPFAGSRGRALAFERFQWVWDRASGAGG